MKVNLLMEGEAPLAILYWYHVNPKKYPPFDSTKAMNNRSETQCYFQPSGVHILTFLKTKQSHRIPFAEFFSMTLFSNYNLLPLKRFLHVFPLFSYLLFGSLSATILDRSSVVLLWDFQTAMATVDYIFGSLCQSSRSPKGQNTHLWNKWT